ncbi:MAG: GNAT family N-acetyltransferase [Gemmatimonadota bacterium]
MSRPDAGPVSIGPLDPRDAGRVAGLMREVIAATPYYTDEARRSEIAKYPAEALREAAADDPGAVLVAKAEGEVVGFCVSRPDDGLVWLSWFGVDPAWRGRGVADALLARLVDATRARGVHKLWCDSRTDNFPSRRALARAGFREICTVENHWYGLDFVLLEKPVPPETPA